MTYNYVSNILISWSQPNSKGSPILEYQIVIQTIDKTFYEEIIHCSGSNPINFASRTCEIPISVLRMSPFNLDYPNIVVAKVRSRNVNGWSDFS